MSGAACAGEILAAVRAVLAKVRAVGENWRFPTNLNHAVASAGMTRAADLLDGALVLVDQDSPAGANVLVRAAFESWLAGLWALFGGDDALLGIELERVKHELALARANRLAPEAIAELQAQQAELKDEAIERLGRQPSSVKYDQIAKRLGPTIKAHTRDQEDADLLAAYDMMYRSHSTFDAHPWKLLGQYLTECGLGLRVLPPKPWQEPLMSAALLAMFLAVLGRWIEEARKREGEEWDGLVLRLVTLLKPS